MSKQNDIPIKNSKKMNTAALSGLAAIIVILGAAAIIFLTYNNCPSGGEKSWQCAGSTVIGTIAGAPVVLVLLIVIINVIAKFKGKNK